MTVYCNGEECDIVCGSYEEGWAAIRFADEVEDSHRDVPLAMVSTDHAREVHDAIEDANETFEVDLDRRLDVRIRRTKVTVTVDGHQLHEYDLYAEDYTDRIDLEETAMTALKTVDMVHRQPSRVLYKAHESGLEVEP